MVMFLVFQMWAGAHHHFPIIIHVIILFDSGRGPMSCRPLERTQLKGPLEKMVAGRYMYFTPAARRPEGLQQDVARSAARRLAPPPTAPPPW
jgi:hypothetical protein